MLEKFFKKFLNKPSSLLIAVEDSYLLKDYKRLIFKLFLNDKNTDFNFDYFDDESFDTEKITESFYKAPFLSKKRVLLINKIEKIDYNKLQKLIPLIKKEKKTFLIFISNEIPSKDKLNKKFYKSFDKNNILYLRQPDEKDLRNFIKTFMEKEKRKITPEAVSLLLENIDNNYLQLENELVKLINGVDSEREIDFKDVLKITYAQNSYSVFDLLNYILDGDITGIEILNKYFENSPSGELIRFYSLLHSQFQKLLLYYYYKQKGYSFSEAAKNSSLNYFDQKRIKSQKSNISFKKLLQKYEILLGYEPLIKFGGPLSYYYTEEMIMKLIEGKNE